MIDMTTYELCKVNKEVRKIKIESLEHAIRESEAMISESTMKDDSIIFLRRKVAESLIDLERLYLLYEND